MYAGQGRNETNVFPADFIKKYKNSCKILYSNKLYPLGEKLKFSEKENGLLKIKLICYEKIPSIYILPYNFLGIKKKKTSYFNQYVHPSKYLELSRMMYNYPKNDDRIQINENKTDKFHSHFSKNNSKTIYEEEFYSLQSKFIFFEKDNELLKNLLTCYEFFSPFKIIAINCLGSIKKKKLNLNHYANPCQFQDLSKMIYDIGKNANSIQIFGEQFVENNKNKCVIIYKNHILPLQKYFPPNFISKEDKKLELFLMEKEDITNRSYMFADCKALEEFSFIHEAQKEINEFKKEEEKGLYFEFTDV